MKRAKEEAREGSIDSVQDELDEVNEHLKGEHGVISLLFGIRTEVLNTQRQIDEISVTQGEMKTKVDELGKKLLEPDEGLFARVRDLEGKIETAEKKDVEREKTFKHVDKLIEWREGWGKFAWYILFTICGIFAKYIFDAWISKSK